MSKERIENLLVDYNQSYKENNDIYHMYAKAVGMTDTTFWLLYSLWEHGETYTQKELCAEWSCIAQTLNSALKNLEKKGLIELQYVEGSRKNKRILFTKQGYDFAQKTVAPLMQAEKNAISCFEEQEWILFLQQLRQFNQKLKKEVDLLINQADSQEVAHE